jgi:hypothetical protein
MTLTEAIRLTYSSVCEAALAGATMDHRSLPPVDQAWKESEQVRLEKVLGIAMASGNKEMQASIERELEALKREEPSPLIAEYLNENGEIRADL